MGMTRILRFATIEIRCGGRMLRTVRRVIPIRRLSRWRTDHEKARYAWDYRWGRNIDCGAALASMVAKECDAIACQRCSPRTAANCDERCRCQPKGISPRIPQRGLRKCCSLRLWIVFRLWLSGLLQLLPTLRNKLRRTLRHLQQQLRHSLRASTSRLRRAVRTDFLLRVPATLVIGVTDGVADERSLSSYGALMRSAPCVISALR